MILQSLDKLVCLKIDTYLHVSSSAKVALETTGGMEGAGVLVKSNIWIAGLPLYLRYNRYIRPARVPVPLPFGRHLHSRFLKN